MMVYLMRHGIAEPFGCKPDPQRSLTAVGRARVQAQFEACQPLLAVQRIVHSPYLRAQQTAQIGAQVLTGTPLIVDGRLTPDDDPATALAVLEQYADLPTLYVTHNPLIGRLIGLLCEGSSRVVEPMETGMLAAIECNWPAAGMGTLAWKRAVPR